MNSIFLLGSLILIVSSLVVYIKEGEYSWSIKVNTPKDRLNEIITMFENNGYINYHPFCTSNSLKIDRGEEKQFEIVEETLLLGFYPLKIVSTVYYKKLSETHYSYNVPLKVLFLEVNFNSEFIITQTDEKIQIEEAVQIKGSLFSSFIIGKAAYPEHLIMLDRIKSKFS